MNRARPGLWLVALASALGFAIGPFACSSPESLSGQGGPCNVVTDCQDGFVCAMGSNGTRVCTNNLSSLQPPQDAGETDATGKPTPQADGPAGDDGAVDSTAPASEASPPESDVASPPVADVATVDVEKPPADSSKPEDTGTPPQEAAASRDTGADDAGASE